MKHKNLCNHRAYILVGRNCSVSPYCPVFCLGMKLSSILWVVNMETLGFRQSVLDMVIDKAHSVSEMGKLFQVTLQVADVGEWEPKQERKNMEVCNDSSWLTGFGNIKLELWREAGGSVAVRWKSIVMFDDWSMSFRSVKSIIIYFVPQAEKF